MSQITKILLRVVIHRITNKLRDEIAVEQYGFVAGKGTSNAIFVVRNLMERAIEKQKDVYMCFIDYEKAFDRVRHVDLMRMLEEIGVDDKDRRVICNLYWDQEATVKIGEYQTEYQRIRRGVRQGCVMSPHLFNLYSEIILRSLQGREGISVGGVNINNVRYADDTVLVADSAEKLQDLLSVVVQASEGKGLAVNLEKTKVMVASKQAETPRLRIQISGVTLEQVGQFKYLGSILSEDCRCRGEIRSRIGIAKTAFKQMRSFLTNRSISIGVRKRAIKTYIWSTLLYGAETWTISKEMVKRIEAMEMWIWRRMMRISWVERQTNEEVLRRVEEERSLMMVIRRRQMKFLGHIMRRGELERVVLTGYVEGRRARGRQRETFMNGIARALGGQIRAARILHMTEHRTRWCSMVAEVQEDMARR